MVSSRTRPITASGAPVSLCSPLIFDSGPAWCRVALDLRYNHVDFADRQNHEPARSIPQLNDCLFSEKQLGKR